MKTPVRTTCVSGWPLGEPSNGDFLIDRHPAFKNVWLVGGGSGHGFKHGPAVGKHVAALISCDTKVESRFALATKEKAHQRKVY